jgi:adenylosuccinate synthase
MPVTVLIGAQWGDEGKGRVADWLARQSDAMARYAGGDNAGHTVRVGDQKFQLHLVPSGVVHPTMQCFMGSGMVVNPVRLVRELKMLADQGVDISLDRIHLSARAHVITPGHLELDGASERARGSGSIGTTKRGIGPAYMDKMARTGLLVNEMLNPVQFELKVQQTIEEANKILTKQYGLEPIATADLAQQYREAAEFLKPYISDISELVNNVLEAGYRLLCEGAQGTLLDIDHGHYPYVTSSSSTVGGALTGLGFGPRYVDRVVGVAKAYSTRVGNGPFPTELTDDIGNRIREVGAEYGTTTGRPRRCGWLDALVVRYAVRVNGLTELVLTKLDVLSGLDELRIATAYDLPGGRVTTMPLDSAVIEQAKPVYETLPGWQGDISGARKLSELPENAQRYITRVQELSGVPFSMISVGAERDQAIIC